MRSHAIIAKASNARLYEEVLKLFLGGAAEKAYALLSRTGLFAAMFPQLSAWMKHSDSDYKTHWLRKACVKIDGWVRSGTEVTPAMMFAAMFADYHEDMAEQAALHHHIRLEKAIGIATIRHLAELAPRILIPRRVSEQITRILIDGLRASEENPRDDHPSHHAHHAQHAQRPHGHHPATKSHHSR